MGGGVGIACPCRYRVATERTVFAMPETTIGLFPDVGGGRYLSRLRGRLAQYLALTGARLNGAECKALRLATPDGQPFRGSVEYALAAVEWVPGPDRSALVGSITRDGDDRVHDITTSFGADVPQTRTRLFLVYRVSTGFATEETGSAFGSRFDMQLNQGLPFLPSNAGQWEVLLSMRNTLRDPRFGMSMLDELLAVSTPTRVVGGVQVKF